MIWEGKAEQTSEEKIETGVVLYDYNARGSRDTGGSKDHSRSMALILPRLDNGERKTYSHSSKSSALAKEFKVPMLFILVLLVVVVVVFVALALIFFAFFFFFFFSLLFLFLFVCLFVVATFS